jgi:predicted component of type VI protein secretion system
MTLTLEVTDPEAMEASPRRVRVRGHGGTIGRSPSSTLVLSNQHVSGQHALIHYSGGVYSIEDCSTNGVCLDSVRNRLPKSQRVPLKSGTVILIDRYEIRVVLESEGVAQSSVVADVVPALIPPDEGLLHDDFQFHDTPPRSDDLLGGLDGSGATGPNPGALLIPPDWHHEHVELPIYPERPLTGPNRQEPVVPAVAVKGEVDAVLLAEVLAGAGLSRADLTPELAESLGRILRVVVAGVMDVLSARQRTKEEFRVDVTKFQRTGKGNNPLKFSTTVEAALHNLLVTRLDGYLGPVEAFEDAFEDLRYHQVATLHGVRHAFASMLSRFDPERLQEEFDGQQKGVLVAVPARLRYWDLYRVWFRGMVGDVDASFRDLFGDEFAEAYDEQLRRLKAQGRSGASQRDDDRR